MAKRTDLKIPYGIADFKRIRNEGWYYVDKTEYVAMLEERDSFVFFVRPRRFGKSLFVDMLRLYYDRNEKANFEKLFGGLWLGEHPTENRNRYLVLALDFSKAGATGGRSLQECFDEYLTLRFDDFIYSYPDVFDDAFKATIAKAGALGRFQAIADRARNRGLPIYLIIDEYDNFTNALIRSTGTEPYRSITHGAGFYREWFKKFKGSVDRIFMTGVSPVTMDDLTSGFNIASNVSQDEDFSAMLGFTTEETLVLYRDFKGVGKYRDGDPEEIVRSIKPWYDGYCFSSRKVGKESVFNSDMVLYHLKSMVAKGVPPENMVDRNIATDYNKLETIVELQRQAGAQNCLPAVSELVEGVPYDVLSSFDVDRILKTELLPTHLLNEGIIVPVKRYQGLTYYSFPNVVAGLSYLFLLNGWSSERDSYIVELKYSKPGATDAEVAAKAEEGIVQLRRYAADPAVPALSAGTRLHLILYQFQGTELIRVEEIAP